jgi:hypothetical protein
MPGVVHAYASENGCGGISLPLPPTVAENLEGPALKRVNMILLEYARDVTLLQSKAYEAVLAAFCET